MSTDRLSIRLAKIEATVAAPKKMVRWVADGDNKRPEIGLFYTSEAGTPPTLTTAEWLARFGPGAS